MSQPLKANPNSGTPDPKDTNQVPPPPPDQTGTDGTTTAAPQIARARIGTPDPKNTA